MQLYNDRIRPYSSERSANSIFMPLSLPEMCAGSYLVSQELRTHVCELRRQWCAAKSSRVPRYLNNSRDVARVRAWRITSLLPSSELNLLLFRLPQWLTQRLLQNGTGKRLLLLQLMSALHRVSLSYMAVMSDPF
jgi:hypothetical protein